MFSLENKQKIKNLILVFTIVLSSIFLVGFKNSFALSSDLKSFQSSIVDFRSSNSVDDTANYVISTCKEKGFKYIYFSCDYSVFSNSHRTYHFFIYDYDSCSFSCSDTHIFLDKPAEGDYYNCSFNTQGTDVSFYNGNQFGLVNVQIDSGVNIKDVIKTSHTLYDKDGNVLFRVPLMKEVEKIIPEVTADTMVIVTVTGVGLIGLSILLWLLSTVLRRFYHL